MSSAINKMIQDDGGTHNVKTVGGHRHRSAAGGLTGGAPAVGMRHALVFSSPDFQDGLPFAKVSPRLRSREA